MATITISRMLGSLGCEIAHALKDRLGYRLVWRELINQAAIKSGAPHTALAMIDELSLLGLSLSEEEIQAYLDAVEQVMVELADEGDVVILGRAGQAILSGRSDVLHVLLVAPECLRAERVAGRLNISLEGAAAQVKASDRSRRRYLKRCYHLKWENPGLYDLVINTERLDAATAAGIIIAALDIHSPGVSETSPVQELPFERR